MSIAQQASPAVLPELSTLLERLSVARIAPHQAADVARYEKLYAGLVRKREQLADEPAIDLEATPESFRRARVARHDQLVELLRGMIKACDDLVAIAKTSADLYTEEQRSAIVARDKLRSKCEGHARGLGFSETVGGLVAHDQASNPDAAANTFNLLLDKNPSMRAATADLDDATKNATLAGQRCGELRETREAIEAVLRQALAAS
jgi:hypothetical protein